MKDEEYDTSSRLASTGGDMSELTSRLALYGAIDEALVAGDDPGFRELVATVLPAYTDPSTVGWYDQFRSIIGENEFGEPALGPPDIEVALAELSNTEPPTAVDAAQRVVALWAVDSTIGQRQRDSLVAALRPAVAYSDDQPDATTGTPLADHADRIEQIEQNLVAVLELFGRHRTNGSLRELADTLATEQIFSRSVTAALGVIVNVRGATISIDLPSKAGRGPGDSQAVASQILTTVKISGFTGSIDDLKQKMNPRRWPQCLPTFWCSMDSTVDALPNDDVEYFIERVGDCPTSWFHPCLKFAGQDKLDTAGKVIGFDLLYGLWDPASPAEVGAVVANTVQDDRLLVDDGVIKALVGAGVLTVTFSKVICFRDPLPSASIALLVGATGWANQAAAMVTGCLA